MYRIALPALLAAVTVAFPASALEAGVPEHSETTTEKPAKERKVCKSDVSTGSIMAKRTCRTKAEWDAITARSRDDMDKIRSRDTARSVGGITR